MARVEPRDVSVRGGTVRVRGARSDDAGAHLDLLRDVHGTGDHLVTGAAEVETDAGAESSRMREIADAPSGLLLVAEARDGFAEAGGERGDLVGTLEFRGYRPARLSHVGWFMMGVRSTWRGRGVGQALLDAMLAWATAHPTIEKVSLGVLSGNDGAMALYRSRGFVEEGRKVREIRVAPGRYVDDVLMYRFVKT
jgi:RimJ/RimL family protein N-acetyltransferase